MYLLLTSSLQYLQKQQIKINFFMQQYLNTILEMYPNAKRIYINSGHCPQDEMPVLTNDLICKFINNNKIIN